MRKVVSAIAATFVAWIAAGVVVSFLPLGGPLGALAVALSSGSPYAVNATYGALEGLLILVLTIILARPLYRRLLAVRLGKRQAGRTRARARAPARSHRPSLTQTVAGGHQTTPLAGDQKVTEAAITAKVGVTAKGNVPATQAAQRVTTSPATPKIATVRERVLRALGFDDVTNNARKLAFLASVAVGAIVTLRGVAPAWVGTYTQVTPGVAGHCVWGDVPGGVFTVPAPTCYPDRPELSVTVPGHFETDWLLQAAPHWLSQGVLAAVVTFLAIAALRWAWRSYR